MKTPDFKELYKPYNQKASLEETLTWLKKECKVRGIDEAIRLKAVALTFLEMSQGKIFPIDGGDTGFTDIPHACQNLYMLKVAIELNNRSEKAFADATEGMLQARIETYVKRNKRREYWQHLKRNLPVLKMFIG